MITLLSLSFDLFRILALVSIILSITAFIIAVKDIFILKKKTQKDSEDLENNENNSFLGDDISEPELNEKNIESEQRGDNYPVNYEMLTDLCDGVVNDKITTRDDLYVLYSLRPNKEYKSFNSFLKSLHYWLMTVTPIKNKQGEELSSNQIIRIKDFISRTYQQENEKYKFRGISTEERTSLLSVASFSRDSKNYTTICQELNKLSKLLKIKQERQDNSVIEGRINRLALVVSLLSFISSILLSFSTNTLLDQSINEQQHISHTIDSISARIGENPIISNQNDSKRQ